MSCGRNCGCGGGCDGNCGCSGGCGCNCAYQKYGCHGIEPNDPCKKPGCPSLCTGDKNNNLWWQCGKCQLDLLTYDQVEFILQRNPNAKADLIRITNDPNLLLMAQEIKLLADDIEDNLVPYRMINNPKQTLPFYTLYGGNIDSTIR